MAEDLGTTSLRYVSRNSVTSVICLRFQSSSLELLVELYIGILTQKSFVTTCVYLGKCTFEDILVIEEV